MTKEQAIEKIQAIIDCNLRELNTMPQHEALQNEVEALDMAIKALEQQPSDDVMAIHTQGLAEGIRCAMCTNSMKSDRGCDGGCVVDEDMYKKVMETIKSQMFNQPISDDCVSRQAIIDMTGLSNWFESSDDYNSFIEELCKLPPVTPPRCIAAKSMDKLEQIEQIVASWNNDASHSFEDMCKINGILKE